MMYLTPPSTKSGIMFVYRVKGIHNSTACASRGLDAADIEFMAALSQPITIQELKEHRDLRSLSAVVSGFHGTIFPVQSRKHKQGLIGMAIDRAPNLRHLVPQTLGR